MFAPLQKRHERQFCRPIYAEFLKWATMTGAVSLPADFAINPYPYMRSQWIPPGMPAVDPLKEGRANADSIAARLKSPQECTAARGRDYEEVLDEIEMAMALQKERGILPEPVTNSTKTNPASLDDGEEEEVADEKSARRVVLPLRPAQ
jgi:capsid protein